MDGEATRQLTLKLLAIADRMEQRDARFADQLRQHVTDLQRATQAVSGGGQQFARDALEALRSQVRDAVAGSIAEAAEASRQQLESTARVAARSAQEVNEATLALRRQRNAWLWTGPLVLAIGALMTAGGSSYLVWKNMAELKRASFGQDILRATESGALTRCGDALCAKVGATPRRYGRQGEYLLLQD